jgi:cell division protein ZapA
MEKNSVKVNILGSEYALKSDADPEYISDLASYVDQKMEKLQQGSSIHAPLKIAVLTAVNISDELFRLKRKHEKIVKEIESASEEITENLDNFLNQYSDLVK